ncbi:hypothetical protein [Xanthomonas arboricola]|uniref:hypothetical protein n=1 Tax=Xanthomonas arboricola TaxID=56448 RepID=UPI003EBAD08A
MLSSADGNVTLRQSYDNGVLKRQQLFYDDQGRVVRIVQTLPDNVTRLLETSRYDAAGRLRGYRYSLVRNEQGSGMTTPEGYTHTYRYTYLGAETYLTQQVIGTSTHKDFKTSNSTSTYDAWGKLLSVRENTPGGQVDDRRPVGAGCAGRQGSYRLYRYVQGV